MASFQGRLITKQGKTSLCPSEHAEQVALVQIFRAKYPKLAKQIFAIPNAGKRSYRTGRMFKSEGMTAGVPDLFLAVPVEPYHGLWIELKRRKKALSKISDAQKEILQIMVAAGYAGLVCYGADMALDTIDKYLAGKLEI